MSEITASSNLIGSPPAAKPSNLVRAVNKISNKIYVKVKVQWVFKMFLTLKGLRKQGCQTLKDRHIKWPLHTFDDDNDNRGRTSTRCKHLSHTWEEVVTKKTDFFQYLQWILWLRNSEPLEWQRRHPNLKFDKILFLDR